METLKLNDTGFLRLKQVLQLIPVGETTWRVGVKEGILPQPVKVAGKVNLWRVEDIKELISSYSNKEDNNPVNNKGGNSWAI